jgi:hypothetical protein
MGKRKAWMDELHEFRENHNDGSMCLCGIPGTYHDTWEQRMADRSFTPPWTIYTDD